MKRSRYSDDQIRSILSQLHGISIQTFYRWKALFADHGDIIVGRMRNLELENRRLKRTVANLDLNLRTLKLHAQNMGIVTEESQS